jgi:hypothetical protein
LDGNQNGKARHRLQRAPGRLDAGHARRVEVHDDHVRLERGQGDERRFAAGGVVDLEPLLLQQGSEPCAKELVVVNDEHA